MGRGYVILLLLAAFAASCARTVAPPVVTTPRYPDYVFPTLSPPDPRQAELLQEHEAAWRWFQAGDIERAETGFQTILKRSPKFYPSDTAMGYLDLARKNFEPAVAHFDRVLQSNAGYVPALRKTGRKDIIDAIVEKLELDTRRVMLEFDEDSAEDREKIASVYRHARVVSHVTSHGRVAIEADVPRRVLDRVKTAGGR